MIKKETQMQMKNQLGLIKKNQLGHERSYLYTMVYTI